MDNIERKLIKRNDATFDIFDDCDEMEADNLESLISTILRPIKKQVKAYVDDHIWDLLQKGHSKPIVKYEFDPSEYYGDSTYPIIVKLYSEETDAELAARLKKAEKAKLNREAKAAAKLEKDRITYEKLKKQFEKA